MSSFGTDSAESEYGEKQASGTHHAPSSDAIFPDAMYDAKGELFWPEDLVASTTESRLRINSVPFQRSAHCSAEELKSIERQKRRREIFLGSLGLINIGMGITARPEALPFGIGLSVLGAAAYGSRKLGTWACDKILLKSRFIRTH